MTSAATAERPREPAETTRSVDRFEIEQLILRYCRAVDRLDLESLPALYHPDAIENHGSYRGEVPGFVEWIRNRHRTIPFSMHAVSNILIEFLGEDTAVCESYVTVRQLYGADAGDSLAGLTGTQVPEPTGRRLAIAWGRYVDRITRRDGVWRFLRRTATHDAGVILDTFDEMNFGENFSIGARNFSDPIYQELSAALEVKKP